MCGVIPEKNCLFIELEFFTKEHFLGKITQKYNIFARLIPVNTIKIVKNSN
jgi:hypothetical protein